MADLISDASLAHTKRDLTFAPYVFRTAPLAEIVRGLIARLEAAENLVRDLRASLVLNGDAISFHKAVALSNRVEAHFALVAKAES